MNSAGKTSLAQSKSVEEDCIKFMDLYKPPDTEPDVIIISKLLQKIDGMFGDSIETSYNSF